MTGYSDFIKSKNVFKKKSRNAGQTRTLGSSKIHKRHIGIRLLTLFKQVDLVKLDFCYISIEDDFVISNRGGIVQYLRLHTQALKSPY